MSQASRNTVVAEACTWLHTPYHHRGRLKGIGVDCAQFPLQVYAACSLIDLFAPGDYPPDPKNDILAMCVNTRAKLHPPIY